MGKVMTLPLLRDAAEVVKNLQTSVQQSGGQFRGDVRSGHFLGHGLEGHYEVLGNALNVTIDNKPFFVPWSMVEQKLREFFG